MWEINLSTQLLLSNSNTTSLLVRFFDCDLLENFVNIFLNLGIYLVNSQFPTNCVDMHASSSTSVLFGDTSIIFLRPITKNYSEY